MEGKFSQYVLEWRGFHRGRKLCLDSLIMRRIKTPRKRLTRIYCERFSLLIYCAVPCVPHLHPLFYAQAWSPRQLTSRTCHYLSKVLFVYASLAWKESVIMWLISKSVYPAKPEISRKSFLFIYVFLPIK